MMKIKFIRKIDELGRIVVPKDVRRALNFEKESAIEITVEDGAVILKKTKEQEYDKRN